MQWMLSVVKIMYDHFDQAVMLEYERVCISPINLAVGRPFATSRYDRC